MTSSTRDWFRKTAWSADDERDYRAHLERARVDRRPQYLRIQAAHLLENGLPEPALALLDEFLAGPDADRAGIRGSGDSAHGGQTCATGRRRGEGTICQAS